MNANMANEVIIPTVEALTTWHGFLWGVVGGIGAEVAGIFKIRTELATSCPNYLKTFYYWLTFILMTLIGGGIVVAYMESGFKFNPILSINIGATAPFIFGSMVNKTPELSPGNTD